MNRRQYSVPGIALVVAVFVLLAAAPAGTQQEQQRSSPLDAIPWEDGPTVGQLGDIAEIKVPQGFRFTGAAGAKQFLEMTENPTSGSELGILIPPNRDNESFWFMVFEFNDVGYVKDDEKNKLDGDAILTSIQEGTAAANEERKRRGWTPFYVLGWAKPPYYDQSTNNLTWAIRGSGSETGGGEETINYSVRVLGRRGTMNIDLVLSAGQLERVRPYFDLLLKDFSFSKGNKYAEFRAGDKIAAYGLTALVAGGAGAALVKSGLLQKFWKVIALAFIALATQLKRIFNWIRGRRSEEQEA